MDPFLGEIRLVAFNFAPQGWAFCAGQVLPISQNTALFSLLGNAYGGDGMTTFALPDLRGRVPVGAGQSAAGSDLRARLDRRPRDRQADGEPAARARASGPGEQRRVGDEKSERRRPGGRGRLLRDAGREDERGDDRSQRRRPGARQPAAIRQPELHHRPSGDLSFASLSRRNFEVLRVLRSLYTPHTWP
jgi:hypothetical protein